MMFEWKTPSPQMVPRHEAVDVWRASLLLKPESIVAMRRLLSPDEIATEGRFYFEEHRRRYVIARAALRTILAHYLPSSARELRFCYGRYGKPVLTKEVNVNQLQFNLSHSHEIAIFAIARGRAVGIDVEYIRNTTSVDEIVDRFFAPNETTAFGASSKATKLENFYASWTCKEAYLKARGLGLSFPLARVRLPRMFDAKQPHQMGSGNWSVVNFSPASNYLAALVAAGTGWNLSCWQWTFSHAE